MKKEDLGAVMFNANFCTKNAVFATLSTDFRDYEYAFLHWNVENEGVEVIAFNDPYNFAKEIHAEEDVDEMGLFYDSLLELGPFGTRIDDDDVYVCVKYR